MLKYLLYSEPDTCDGEGEGSKKIEQIFAEFLNTKELEGLPWWSSGYKPSFQRRGCGFHSLLGN